MTESIPLPGRPGTLPDDGPAEIGGVRLPAGHRCLPDPSFAGAVAGDTPFVWVSDSPVHRAGHLWAQLRRRFPETGLWPLLLGEGADDAERWRAGEVEPEPVAAIDGIDPVEVLRRGWAGAMLAGDDDPEEVAHDAQRLEPFGTEFPGLAKAPLDGPRNVFDTVADELLRSRIVGVAAVRRPADAIAAIGFMGGVNRDLRASRVAAVARSWESRFGAELVGLGHDTIDLFVPRRPASEDAALAVAAELFALCGDAVDQGAGSIRALARQLTVAPLWSLWWD